MIKELTEQNKLRILADPILSAPIVQYLSNNRAFEFDFGRTNVMSTKLYTPIENDIINNIII